MGGLRFFGTDWCELPFGNTITANSNADLQDFMFDNKESTKWISDDKSTSGLPISVEIDFGQQRCIDSVFIRNTNISDIEVQYYVSPDWATFGDTNATILKSADSKNVFIKSNETLYPTKMKIYGTDTITLGQEKYVSIFRAFCEIGQFEYYPMFEPKRKRFQSVFNTMDGRRVIIERGERFEAMLKFKSHVNQNDIDLIEELLERREPFFIWACAGDTSVFTYSFYPFRFKDLFKVSIEGDSKPYLTKNYYKAGYNDDIKISEVA